MLLATDMDALPVKEQTGLAYASTRVTKNDGGESVPVMHACGHDVGVAFQWIGAANLLAGAAWHGAAGVRGPAGGGDRAGRDADGERRAVHAVPQA